MNTRSGKKPVINPQSNSNKSKKKQPKNKLDNPKFVASSSSPPKPEEKPIFELKPETPPLNMAVPNRFDTRMIDKSLTIPPTPRSAIHTPTLGDDFNVKGHHLKLIQDSTFDGRMKSDPHKHITKFSDLCRMFKYGEGYEESVKLTLFPYSLTGEALSWFEELEENTIRTWEELRQAFITRFFPPALVRKLLRNIQGFRQDEGESVGEAWGRFKEMLRSCHGHRLDRDEIVETFFYGLNRQTQNELDLAGGGNFMYRISS